MKRCAVRSISVLEPKRFMRSRLSIKFLELFKNWPVSVAYEVIHKNGADIPFGMHRKTSELVYVIKGRARADLGGRSVMVGPGDYLLVPPGVKHRFVTAKMPLVALSVFSPPMTFENLDAIACPEQKRKRK